ncbi:hypothetical protein BGW39_009445 [Mortierella sp. 14UC]|nr:hypothetical protein BGW39_009445 [Mortierella sp. 14UC]
MSVFLTRLRIGITGLVAFVFLLSIVYYAVYFSSLKPEDMAPHTLNAKEGITIAVHIILLGHYLYLTVTKIPRIPKEVPRYARALVLFLLTGYMLYFYLSVLSAVFENNAFLCRYSFVKSACGVARVVQLFGTVAGFLVMYEVALTLKETDPNPKPKPLIPEAGAPGTAGATGAPAPNAVPYQMQMTPPPSFPQQQTPFQQGAFFPQQQQQQPYALAQQQPLQNANAKFEAPGQQQQQQFQQQQLYQQQQQQLYQGQQQQQQLYQGQQPSQQQQQQNPYSQQPLAPGSLVTTTPQPGGQAIAPYTSSGGASVAVSPVLPAGGYSTPSPSVGHQSPVHRPQ